ncbi:hypothetical protein HNP73_001215 [Amaricoccus macauensis]|uniref:CAAX prenyl protease 2/Lysostaphin resistance protein A-like domain-containing protein n=1 Tax=Amaricoccus macauensis TaxID=57001 RepID=A0A840SK05_9RHOB|nr:type II CAAX endopeptidase family protein [Amaricoccus macauensis]MBB5221294.1 hypothetical protein [Amaricoccus macauensis]
MPADPSIRTTRPTTHLTSRFAAFVAPARPRPALWRLVTGTGFALAGWFGAALVVMPRAGDGASGVLLFLASFGGLVLGLSVAVRLLHRRSFASLVGPGGLRLRPLAIGAGAALGVAAVSGTVAVAIAPPVQGQPVAAWLRTALVALPLIALQSTAEELLFRGYLLQGLAARFRSRLVWFVLPAVIFGALHWNPADYGAAAPLAVASITLSGLLFADITVRTGNLSAAIGIHIATNVVAILVVSPPSTLDGLALFILVPGSGGAGGTGPLIALDLALTLAAWGVWIALRRRILAPQSGASM